MNSALHGALVECVPNFSEGANLATVDAIVGSVISVPGIFLLGRESDADHNRSVVTFAGPPSAVCEAAVRAVKEAAFRIDLTSHSGVHPRIGAADVVPFVPIENCTMDECAQLAHQAGERIWREARVPVYFYEFAARRPDRVRLEDVRRGGFAVLREQAVLGPARAPDCGGPALHPTAGACAVSARRILIACNVNLASQDLELAKRIARQIRASNGGFPHVKALGLELASRGLVQVSMNLTHFEATPLELVFAEVERLAAHSGVKVAATEIIGFIPARAAAAAPRFIELCENFDPSKVLETRIAELRALR